MIVVAQGVGFPGYIMFSHIVLTFRCLSDFYQGFIQGFSKITMLPTSILRTSLSIDLSTSATQIALKYDEVDGGGGKLIEKLYKS